MKNGNYYREPVNTKAAMKYIVGGLFIPLALPLLYLFGALNNKLINKEKEKTAILVSANYSEIFGELFYNIPALYFSESIRGKNVKVFLNAKILDFLNVLIDEKYENIILDGHGNCGSWYAQDFGLKPEDIDFIKDKLRMRF